MTPETIFHATGGALSLITGVTALTVRKGSPLHRTAGNVFFVVMLVTAGTGVYLGFKTEINNAIAGIITLYLLITAWLTVRRPEGKTGLFELGAFLFAVAGAAAAYFFAYAGMRDGTALLGGAPFFIFATIIAIAALADLSVIVRRGIAGRQRIARHLWRMHLGFAAAVGSFFPGQLEIFPEYIRGIRPFIVLFTPPLAVLGLMFLWLVVVLFTKWYERAVFVRAGASARLREGTT
jgi:hypothetical protein